ncbi:MAG: SdpI family protein [Bacteroidota bacterium]
MELFSYMMVGIVYAVSGFLMQEYPAKKRNYLWGYATCSSMKSQDRWDFAQKYSPKLFINYGLGLIVLGLIENYFGAWLSADRIFRIAASALLILLPIIQTELELKKRFKKVE